MGLSHLPPRKAFISTLFLIFVWVLTPPAFSRAQLATWYSQKEPGGEETASGVPLNDQARLAAHPYMPMGSVMKVINEKTGQWVEVLVVDRGPDVPTTGSEERVVDLTPAAFRQLGSLDVGIVKVRLEVVRRGKGIRDLLRNPDLIKKFLP